MFLAVAAAAALGRVGVRVSKERDEARKRLAARPAGRRADAPGPQARAASSDELHEAETASSKTDGAQLALGDRRARRAARGASLVGDGRRRRALPARTPARRAHRGEEAALRGRTVAREACGATASGADLRVLKRSQDLLGRMHDVQMLIDQVRQTQASLTPPSVAVWRDLDTLVASLEDDCRRLHARYMRVRDELSGDRRTPRRTAAPRPPPARRRGAQDNRCQDLTSCTSIRHGLAEERGDAWPDDTKRPLTDEGMSRMRKSARGLARVGVTIDVVLTSPLVRARQTAEIVAGGLDPRPSLVNVDSLAPDGSYAAVLADLEKHARKLPHRAGRPRADARRAGRPPDRLAPSRSSSRRARSAASTSTICRRPAPAICAGC